MQIVLVVGVPEQAALLSFKAFIPPHFLRFEVHRDICISSPGFIGSRVESVEHTTNLWRGWVGIAKLNVQPLYQES